MGDSIKIYFKTHFFYKKGSRLKLKIIYRDYLEYLKTQNLTSDCYTYKQFQLDLESLFNNVDLNCHIDKIKSTNFILNLQKIYFQNKEQGDTFKSHLIEK